jgi:DNA-binding XRE family transcriptional regulator
MFKKMKRRLDKTNVRSNRHYQTVNVQHGHKTTEKGAEAMSERETKKRLISSFNREIENICPDPRLAGPRIHGRIFRKEVIELANNANNKISIRLRELRGVFRTQEQFAKELGVSRSLYQKYECGEREPSKSFLQKLKEKYPEIDLNDFF